MLVAMKCLVMPILCGARQPCQRKQCAADAKRKHGQPFWYPYVFPRNTSDGAMHEDQNEKGYDDPHAQGHKKFRRFCVLDENGRCHSGDKKYEAGHHCDVKYRIAIVHASNAMVTRSLRRPSCSVPTEHEMK